MEVLSRGAKRRTWSSGCVSAVAASVSSTFQTLKADTMKPLMDRHVSADTKRIITDCATVYPFAMDKDFQARSIGR